MQIDSLAYTLIAKFQADRERLERYMALANLCPLPAFIQGRDGMTMLYVNPAYVNLTGYALADVQEDLWVKSVHPDDRVATLAWWKTVVATEFGGKHTHRIIRKDGHATIKATVVINRVEDNGYASFIVPDPLNLDANGCLYLPRLS